MSRRRPPRSPWQRLDDGKKAQRTLAAGLVVNAAPIAEQATAVATALGSVAGVSQRASKVDQFTLPGAGAQDLTLTYLPELESWNVTLFTGAAGRAARFTTDYTVSGQTLSLTSGQTPLSGDLVQVQYDYLTGQPEQFNDFDGDSPVLRGTNIAFINNSATGTVNYPAGSAVGDFAVLMVGHGWNANTPSGWTSEDNQTGSNWNGAVFSRVLDSTTISTGHEDVLFGSGYYGEIAVAVFVGATAGIREVKAVRSGTGGSPNSLTTTSTAESTDTALYFGSARASSSTTTVNRGTLKEHRDADNEATGALYAQELSSVGTVNAIFSHTVTGSGYYEAIVIVKGV